MPAKHIKIYLLTGQSNSLGTTANKKDDDPAKPEFSKLDKKIPFFWSNRSTTAADGPAAIIGDSDGKITTLQEQQGQGANTTFWGPEVSFGRALYTAGERNFLIVKASRGGGGNGYWVKDNQMYKHTVKTVSRATEELKKLGHTYELDTLLFVQGESNSSDEAAIADQRFTELLEGLREDLPNAEKMNAVIGGIAAAGGSRDLTRKLQKSLADSRDDIAYFSTLDLQPQLYDRLHFDKAAKMEVGERFAKIVRELE